MHALRPRIFHFLFRLLQSFLDVVFCFGASASETGFEGGEGGGREEEVAGLEVCAFYLFDALWGEKVGGWSVGLWFCGCGWIGNGQVGENKGIGQVG